MSIERFLGDYDRIASALSLNAGETKLSSFKVEFF